MHDVSDLINGLPVISDAWALLLMPLPQLTFNPVVFIYETELKSMNESMGLSTVTCHVFCLAARRQEHQRYTKDGSIRQHERLCVALPLVNMITGTVTLPG